MLSSRALWLSVTGFCMVATLVSWLLAAVAKAATAVSGFAGLGAAPFGDAGFGDGGGAGDLAIDSSQNVVAAQHQGVRIALFAEDAGLGGTPLAAFDPSSLSGLDTQNIAVDPSNDAIYTTDTLFGTGVVKFLSDGQATPTYSFDSTFAPSGFVTPAGIAVDPGTGDVLLADSGAAQVLRLSGSTGAQLSSFNGGDTTAGAFQFPTAIAVGPSGSIYVVDTNRVERFSSSGVSQGALPIIAGSQPRSVTTNPQTGNVAVTVEYRGQRYLEIFSATGTKLLSARQTQTLGSPTYGLAWAPTSDRIYVSLGDGLIHTLVRATQPGVDTPVVGQIGRDTAHVSAVIAPGNATVNARLEYCSAASACENYPVSDPNDNNNPWRRGPEHAGITTTVQNGGQATIEDDLPLASNAGWRLRVSADNASDPIDNTSSILNFDSPLQPPTVVAGAAGSVTDSSAELTGTIDTVGGATTYHFEYGLTTNYGSRIPSGEASAGNNRKPRPFTRSISGLQSGTTYHFRLVAKNAAGETAGPDREFTTAGPDEVAPNRAYEQVTPVDKNGAQVNGTSNFLTAADGSWVMVGTGSSDVDGQSALIWQHYLTRRGGTNWSDWTQLDPPSVTSHGILEGTLAGVSSDGTHALVMSNRVLASGGVAGGGNFYVVNVKTGDYEFVGGAPGNDAYQGMAGLQRPGLIFFGGAPDFSWIVFESDVPLLSTVSCPQGVVCTQMYRWTRGHGLALESEKPDGTASPGAIWTPSGNRYEISQVAEDGSASYFALRGDVGVYRRADGQTTPISVIEGDATHTPQYGFFDGASKDGRYAFLHTPAALTADTPGGLQTALYQYDASTGDLVFVSETIFAQHAIQGMSDDGQTVYVNDSHKLVVWRHGQIQDIVTPAPSAAGVASPNGRYYAWLDADQNVQLYDADKQETTCASCPADGSAGGTANLLNIGRNPGNQAARVIHDDGLLLFDTARPLVTADHNGMQDVYSYRNGRLTLISPGDGKYDATFMTSSRDGSDVFFTTDEGLVGQDTDENTDVYDARIGGGFAAQSPPPPNAPCARADCGELASGPVASPAAPSSDTESAGQRKTTNQAKVRLSLGKVSVGSKTVKITFVASERGRVTVRGDRVTTAIRNVSKAGTYTITASLSKKARSMVRAHKKFKLSLKVSLAGGWGSASAKYTRTLGK